MELFDIFGAILGGGLCIAGVLAMYRGTTRASPEGEETKEYVGGSAVGLGLFWLLLGAFFLFAAIGPHVGCVECSKYRKLSKEYLK